MKFPLSPCSPERISWVWWRWQQSGLSRSFTLPPSSPLLVCADDGQPGDGVPPLTQVQGQEAPLQRGDQGLHGQEWRAQCRLRWGRKLENLLRSPEELLNLKFSCDIILVISDFIFRNIYEWKFICLLSYQHYPCILLLFSSLYVYM